jgi:sugar phosphate isomerase/epimerase
MHLGSVRFFWFNPGRQLRNFTRTHPTVALPADERYQRLLAKASDKLRKRQPAFWKQTLRSLAEILPYAAEKGVRLGLENREKFEELPADAEFPEFLRSLPLPEQAGYWHDVGHAELKERMGVITQQRQLEANSERLIGFHLHDVNAEGHDHQPIGTGRIDFKMVSAFWQPHHLLVLELNPRVSADDVLASKQRIEDLLG